MKKEYIHEQKINADFQDTQHDASKYLFNNQQYAELESEQLNGSQYNQGIRVQDHLEDEDMRAQTQRQYLDQSDAFASAAQWGHATERGREGEDGQPSLARLKSPTCMQKPNPNNATILAIAAHSDNDDEVDDGIDYMIEQGLNEAIEPGSKFNQGSESKNIIEEVYEEFKQKNLNATDLVNILKYSPESAGPTSSECLRYPESFPPNSGIKMQIPNDNQENNVITTTQEAEQPDQHDLVSNYSTLSVQ